MAASQSNRAAVEGDTAGIKVRRTMNGWESRMGDAVGGMENDGIL
jgi:hypothetical protein